MRKPVRSTVANKKYFQGGGLAPMKPAAPEEAVGIMASSQPLVDMVAQSAGNPQGGMSPLNYADGGLAKFQPGGSVNVPVPQDVPKSRLRKLGDLAMNLNPFRTFQSINPLRTVLDEKTGPALSGIARYFADVPTDPRLKQFGIDQLSVTELVKKRFPGKEAEVEEIARNIVSETPGIKPKALGEQITQKLSGTSQTEAEKIMDEKFDKEAKEANQKVMPPVFPEIDPISKEEKAESKKLIDEAKQEQDKKIKDEQDKVTKLIDEAVGDEKVGDEEDDSKITKEAEVINQNSNENVKDTTQGTEDRLGRLIKQFTDNAPEYEGVDKGLALMQMGALIAGGTSPNAIKNIADALTVTSEKLIKDKAKRDEYNRQVKLSALQYGIKEDSLLRAEERAEERVIDKERRGLKEMIVGSGGTEYKGKTYKENQSIFVSIGDIQDGNLPENVQNIAVVDALLKKQTAINKAASDLQEKMTIKNEPLNKNLEKYNKAVNNAIDAEVGMSLVSGAMLKVQDGRVTGLAGVFDQIVLEGSSFLGMDLSKNYGDKEAVRNAMRAALQKVVPVTLGATQSANSISNRDVDFLIEAYFGAGALKGGVLTFATENKTEMTKRLQRAYSAMENAQKSAFGEMAQVESILNNQFQPGTTSAASGLLAPDAKRLAEAGIRGDEEGAGVFITVTDKKGGTSRKRVRTIEKGDDGVIRYKL